MNYWSSLLVEIPRTEQSMSRWASRLIISAKALFLCFNRNIRHCDENVSMQSHDGHLSCPIPFNGVYPKGMGVNCYRIGLALKRLWSTIFLNAACRIFVFSLHSISWPCDTTNTLTKLHPPTILSALGGNETKQKIGGDRNTRRHESSMVSSICLSCE